MTKRVPRVYIVTRGSYSDYHIMAAFSTRKKANEYARLFEAEVEVFPLDQPPETWFVTYVRMEKDGTVKEVWKASTSANDEVFCGFDGANNLVCGVITNDAQTAIKVVNEKRAQLIASNTWGQKI